MKVDNQIQFQFDQTHAATPNNDYFLNNLLNEKPLRDYQKECVQRFLEWWDGPEKEALIALATGMGKTITTAACIKAWYAEKMPKGRLLWLTHREELILQSRRELLNYVPRSCGVEQASNHAYNHHDMVVASVQTLRGRRLAFFAKHFQPDLIICDEAHHALAESWMCIKLQFPKSKILNLTATPFRSDISGRLDLGVVLMEKSTMDGIRSGYLVPPKPLGGLEIDLGGVRKRLGDYETSSLETLLCKDTILQASVDWIERHCRQRKTILFAASVEHARRLAENLRQRHFKVAEIYGETPQEERQVYYQQMREGQLDMLINNLCLTEGFDLPILDTAVMLRPTKNAALYIQAIGRILRAAPGKTCGYVLDIIDMPKRIKKDTLYLPTDDDVRRYAAMQNRSVAAVEVFLSWFQTQPPQNPIKNAEELVHLLMPPWLPKEDLLACRQKFARIWTPEGKYSDLLEPCRLRDARQFVKIMQHHGWIYHPPHLPNPTVEEIQEYTPGKYGNSQNRRASDNFNMHAYMSKDAVLRHFIMDVLQDTNTTKQAQKWFDLIKINEHTRLLWYRAILDNKFAFHYISWRNPWGLHFLVWHQNQLRYFHGKHRLQEISEACLSWKDLPDYARNDRWKSQPATHKQLQCLKQSYPYLKEFLEENHSKTISRMTASAMLSLQWHKKELNLLNQLLQTPSQSRIQIFRNIQELQNAIPPEARQESEYEIQIDDTNFNHQTNTPKPPVFTFSTSY